MGAALPYIAMIASAAGGAVSSSKSQSNARKIAARNREAQEKQLKEQRLLDATTQQMQKRSETDEVDYEIGALQVGDRNDKGKRKVRSAPVATGLRVG